LLDVHALSLALRALPNLLELARHLLHALSKGGQLASDGRYVLSGCHVCRFYAGKFGLSRRLLRVERYRPRRTERLPETGEHRQIRVKGDALL
jgi:hypothetical protein